jgi:hemerythrin
MTIVWRKEMSVANDLLDQDHRYLFALANTVELALRTKGNDDALDVAIDQLLEYTEFHFAREEDLQYKVQFPRCHDHRAEHQRIVRELHDLRDRLDRALAAEQREFEDSGESSDAEGGSPPAAGAQAALAPLELESARIVELIRDWVLGHILKRDREMIPCLAQLPPNYS